METKIGDNIDPLIERVEIATTTLNKINFDLEGFKEEKEIMEDDHPFLVRQIALIDRKMSRLIKSLHHATHEKQDADADLGAYRLIHEPKKEAPSVPIKKPTVTKEKKKDG